MKFAHSFKDSLASQDFPSHWVDQAIPYGQLKKCLKHVTKELQEYGLDPETLRALLKPSQEDSPVALRYNLKRTTSYPYAPLLENIPLTCVFAQLPPNRTKSARV
jgi:E3 ubiquitin-protein ligase BAH